MDDTPAETAEKKETVVSLLAAEDKLLSTNTQSATTLVVTLTGPIVWL